MPNKEHEKQNYHMLSSVNNSKNMENIDPLTNGDREHSRDDVNKA